MGRRPSLALSPDGTNLYAGGSHVLLFVINTATATVTGPIFSGPGGIAVSPDGSTVYQASQGTTTGKCR